MLGFTLDYISINNLFNIGSFRINRKIKKVTPTILDNFDKTVQFKITNRFEKKRISVAEKTYLLKTELAEIKKGASQPEIDLVLEKAEKMLKKSKLKLDLLLKEHGLNTQ